MCFVSHTSFTNFVVPYGGIFVINEKVDMTVDSIFANNVSAISYFSHSDVNFGCPLLIFIGNNFYASKICGSLLTTQYTSILYTYTNNAKYTQLNESSISSSLSLRFNININLGNCLSDGLNCSNLKATTGMATIHFGCSPVSYKQMNFIAFNNTGQGTFGHSCSSSPEQYCINFIVLDNIASDGVLWFWAVSHRLVNGYIKGNDKSCLFAGTGVKIILEQCYYDTFTGSFSTQNSKTKYEYEIGNNILICKTSIFIITKKCKNRIVNPMLLILIMICISS